MSVVIAIKEADRVIVGCDDRESCGDLYYDSYIANPKARVIRPGLIVGCAGNMILLELVERKLKDKPVINKNVIFDVLLEIIKENGNTPAITSEDHLDGELIIAYKNKAYLVSSNLAIISIDDYRAIGSGEAVARGSLYTSENILKTSEARIYMAIKAVGENINSVSSNVYITDTIQNEFQLIDLK